VARAVIDKAKTGDPSRHASSLPALPAAARPGDHPPVAEGMRTGIPCGVQYYAAGNGRRRDHAGRALTSRGVDGRCKR